MASSIYKQLDDLNEQVVQMRKFPELIRNHLYPCTKFQITQHQEYGQGLRAYIIDTSGREVFVYLPSRFRRLTESQVNSLNEDIENGKPPSIQYRGMMGRAYDVKIVPFADSHPQSVTSDNSSSHSDKV